MTDIINYSLGSKRTIRSSFEEIPGAKKQRNENEHMFTSTISFNENISHTNKRGRVESDSSSHINEINRQYEQMNRNLNDMNNKKTQQIQELLHKLREVEGLGHALHEENKVLKKAVNVRFPAISHILITSLIHTHAFMCTFNAIYNYIPTPQIQDHKLKEANNQNQQLNHMLQQAVQVISQLEKTNSNMREAMYPTTHSGSGPGGSSWMPPPPPDVF